MREVKKAEERKADIIAMSEKLFSEKGYLNTTTQDIISALNISRGLLYYHFKSKEDILFYIAEKQTKPIFAELTRIANNKDLNAPEKIVAFLDATVTIDPSDAAVAEEEVELMKSLQDAIQLSENTFMMDNINHKIAYKATELFSKILKQGNEEGSLKVEYPEELSAYLMTGYSFTLNDKFYHNNSVEKQLEFFSAFKLILNQTLGLAEPLFHI